MILSVSHWFCLPMRELFSKCVHTLRYAPTFKCCTILYRFVPFCTVLCCFFCARGFLISVRMAHRPPRATKQKALEGFHLMEEDSSNEVCRKVLFSNFCVDRNVMRCHRSPVSTVSTSRVRKTLRLADWNPGLFFVGYNK